MAVIWHEIELQGRKEPNPALWSNLQRLAVKHSARLFQGSQRDFCGMASSNRRVRSESFVCVNEDHQETVRILGHGSDEEIAARIHWYFDYFSDFFDRAPEREV